MGGTRRAVILAATAAALVLAVGPAGASTPGLPPPSLTLKGTLESLAASGPTMAVAVGLPNAPSGETAPGCAIRLYAFSPTRLTGTVRKPLPCEDATVEQSVDVSGLALARNQIGAIVLDSPSPHGDAWSYWRGPRPSGPLREAGDWSWTDSDVPNGSGCAWAVASGGGVIAAAKMPNRLGMDNGDDKQPSCPAGSTTTIELSGATAPRVVVQGSWEPISATGARIALARLDDQALRTGELSIVDLTGRPLPPPRVAPAVVKNALQAWLAPEGTVVDTSKGLYGPGWTVLRNRETTVGEGRVIYRVGMTLRVRRIRGGADRPLVRLRSGVNMLAAGSFGVAVANDDGNGTVRVYRLPWRSIDRTLPTR